MKTTFLTVFLLFLLLFSCKKENQPGQIGQSQDAKISQFKDLLTGIKQKAHLQPEEAKYLDHELKDFRWDKMISLSGKIYVIPNADGKENLVFFEKNNKVKFIQLLKTENTETAVQYLQNLKPDGRITFYTPTNNKAYEFVYKNHRLISRSTAEPDKNRKYSSGRLMDCIHYFWVTREYEDDVLVNETWTYLYSVCEQQPMDHFLPNDEGGGGDGGIGLTTDDQKDKAFDDAIKDSLSSPCLQRIFNELKNLSDGKIAKIIKTFSGEETSNWNWKVKEGPATNQNFNAATSFPPINGEITTTFFTTKMQNSTELSIARTMIHEAIHAYISAYFYYDRDAANMEFPEMLIAYSKKKHPTFSQAQHEEMATNMMRDIGAALIEYARSKGNKYKDYDDQFFYDLAWGGLYDTKAFQNLSDADQQRILGHIVAEETGIATSVDSPSGDPACK